MTCVHRWRLAPDIVASVPAVCVNCGAERTFAGGVPWIVDAPFSENGRPVDLEHSRKPRGVAAKRDRSVVVMLGSE